MKRIQFGCGSNQLDGWINHDADVDITRTLPYGNESVDMIFAEHLCEHVSGPEFFRFLKECHRILRPNGIVRLCMPVLDRLPVDHAIDIILNHGHQAAYTSALIEMFVRLAGFVPTGDHTRKPCDSHWKVISKEKDDLESFRIEGRKA